MGCNCYIYSFIAHLFIAHLFIARLLIAVTALQLQFDHYRSMQMNAMPDNYQQSNINLMLFNEIENFIEVYNNLVMGPRSLVGYVFDRTCLV